MGSVAEDMDLERRRSQSRFRDRLSGSKSFDGFGLGAVGFQEPLDSHESNDLLHELGHATHLHAATALLQRCDGGNQRPDARGIDIRDSLEIRHDLPFSAGLDRIDVLFEDAAIVDVHLSFHAKNHDIAQIMYFYLHTSPTPPESRTHVPEAQPGRNQDTRAARSHGAAALRQRAKEREKKDHNALCAAAMLNYSSHCSGTGGSQAASCSDDYDTCTFACLAAEAMIGCGF